MPSIGRETWSFKEDRKWVIINTLEQCYKQQTLCMYRNIKLAIPILPPTHSDRTSFERPDSNVVSQKKDTIIDMVILEIPTSIFL